MKRMIKASKNRFNIDSVEFTRTLREHLKQILPPNVVPKISLRYNEIAVVNCPSERILVSDTSIALNKMGYNVVNIGGPVYSADEDYDMAAVRGEAFVKIWFDLDDWHDANEPVGYISLQFDNGSVMFEDWYEDWETRLRK